MMEEALMMGWGLDWGLGLVMGLDWGFELAARQCWCRWPPCRAR